MINKTTEELILDFCERYDAFDFSVEIDRRKIDDDHSLLWFIVTAEITKENLEHGFEHFIPVRGESYTLDNAIGQIVQNATSYKKPNMWPRRQKATLPDFDGMNIVSYKQKPS